MSTYTQQQLDQQQQQQQQQQNNNNNQVTSDGGNNNDKEQDQSDGFIDQNVHVSLNRRIEMPPDFMFPECEAPPSDLINGPSTGEVERDTSVVDNRAQPPSGTGQVYLQQPSQFIGELERLKITGNLQRTPNDEIMDEDDSEEIKVREENGREEYEINRGNGNMLQEYSENDQMLIHHHLHQHQFRENSPEDSPRLSQTGTIAPVVRRHKKGNLKTSGSCRAPRRVSFDPLALLLDASLEGELELVKRTASEVADPSAANDEGITALHNAICAGHLDIVTFLVTFGCDVNAQDSDG